MQASEDLRRFLQGLLPSSAQSPQFLAVSPDGTRLYVPNLGSNTVSVIENLFSKLAPDLIGVFFTDRPCGNTNGYDPSVHQR
jgi:DNA-binding beta-propeller fold protein YncE